MAFRRRRQKDNDLAIDAPSKTDGKVVNKLDAVMIASGGKSKPPSAVGRYLKPLWRKKPIRIATLAVVALLILGGGVAVYFAFRPEKPVVKVQSCKGPLLHKASEALAPQKVRELEPIVNEIKQVPDYEQNPNCLIVLVTYYMNSSDTQQASDYLAKLEKVYDPKEGYDSAISRDVKTPQELRPIIDRYKTQSDKYKSMGRN